MSSKHLNKLLEISESLLSELEKEEPSIEAVENLYSERASYLNQIKKELSNRNEQKTDTKEQNTVEGLLKLFREKEMVINKKLITLKDERESRLKQIFHDKKSASFYSNIQRRDTRTLLNYRLRG